jgi:hypothetical protein
MWKGKPIGDGTPFEAERALKPCEFNSRSFRLVFDELCHWPSGKGTGLPIRLGRFDSDMALCLLNDIRVSANGKPTAFEAVV